MAANTKRVFYVKYLSSMLFADILAQRPDVQLDKLENETPDDEAEPILSQAHVYQIGASRQIIAPRLQVHQYPTAHPSARGSDPATYAPFGKRRMICPLPNVPASGTMVTSCPRRRSPWTM